MTSPPGLVYPLNILEIMDHTSITLVPSVTTLAVWSVTQYGQFANFFSHGLGQLHYYLVLLSLGQALPRGSDILAMTLLSQVRAMSHFLQRKYYMVQELEELGRVVETDSSKTWYAQQDTSWLRKALKDLTGKCDEVILVVNEICRVVQEAKLASSSTEAWAVAQSKAASPILRSYNSFSSIGSEAGVVPLRRRYNTQNKTLASNPLTDAFHDGSSTGSPGEPGKEQTSLTPSTPVKASVEDNELASSTSLDTALGASAIRDHDGRPLSSPIQDLLELNLGHA